MTNPKAAAEKVMKVFRAAGGKEWQKLNDATINDDTITAAGIIKCHILASTLWIEYA